MPTKTTNKTSAKKTDPAKPRARAGAAPKTTGKTAATEKAPAASEAAAPAPAKVPQETVSLIDAKPKRRPRTPSELENKPFAHIPISKILEPEAPKAPAPVVPAQPEVVAPEAPDATEEAAAPGGEKIIHLKPPFTVRDLATAMNIRPFQVIGDLMEMNIFAAINQTIEADIAARVCTKHGFIFEKETRKVGGFGACHDRAIVSETCDDIARNVLEDLDIEPAPWIEAALVYV